MKPERDRRFQQVGWDEQELLRQQYGGFTRELLERWGVTVPPARGWRKRLASGVDPNESSTSTQQMERA